MKKIILLLTFLAFFIGKIYSQANYDGDNAYGNFTYCDNWYSNNCVSSSSSDDLIFNYKNGSQTAIYYDWNWADFKSIQYAATFPVSEPFNGNGNGINFFTKVENSSSYSQTINIPLSYKGTGTGEFNPLNGDLTIAGIVYNDDNKPFNVWFGTTSKSLYLNSYIVGNSSVNFTMQNSNYGIVQINSNMPNLSSTSFSGGVNINRGELWFNSGCAINGGTINVGNGDDNICKLYINTTTGSTTINNAIIVPSNSTASYIGGLNSSGTNTFSGTITLNSYATFENFGGGTIEFSGVISGGSVVNIGRISGTGNAVVKFSNTGNTNTGLTTVNTNSTLQLSAAGSIKSGNNVTVKSGGTLQISANQTIGNLDLSDGGNLTIDNGVTLTITGTYTGGTGTINNQGTIILQGTSGQSFPGSSAVINNGTSNTMTNLTIDNATGVNLNNNLILSGTLTINSGKILNVNAGNQLTVSTALTNNGTLNLLSSASGTATILTPATISGSGTASVQQYLTGALNSGTGYPNGRFWYVATPVTEVKSDVFNAAATANKLWYYTESAHGYTEITVNTTDLTVGTGYVARLGADATINFSGTGLYTGDKTISLTYNSGNAKSGFNLIGNPYPSFLDWQQVQDWHANPYTSPINPTIWVRSFSGTAMGFDTYNASLETGVSSNGNTVTQYIAPLQAFWVETSASSSITLTNTMRYAQDQTASGNKLKAPAVNAATQQLLRLQVSNSTNSDESIIAFNANASDAYDRYDSHKMLNDEVSIPEIYTYAGDHQLAINCMNSIIFNKEYALGFSAAETNNFEIKATEINNFDTGTKVILKDKLLNQETELTVGTTYSFASDAATTSDRFSIIFRAAGDVTGVDADKEQNILVYRNGNNQITVVCNAALDNSSSVSVYNAVGQKLTRQKLTGATTVINAAFTPGVYVVMVNNAGKQQISKMAIK